MKKLISIGVALAVLAMIVLPLGAAAQCDYDGVAPATYSKIPFAIVQTGLMLVGDIIGALPSDMGIPAWVATITDTIAPWAGGPLAWSVDMLAWGLSLFGSVLAGLDSILAGAGMTLPFPLSDVADVLDTVACGLLQPFSCNVTGPAFDPC